MTPELPHILAACRRRERTAERALYQRYAPRVLTLCRRYARDESEAMDFLQECWILLFDKLAAYQPEKGHFEGWLHRLCTNRVLDLLRRQKRLPHTLELVASMDTADATYDDAVEPAWSVYSPETLLAAIRALPEGYRQVLNLAVFEGWSHAAIGEQLGISASSSRSQLTRARRALRGLLESAAFNHQGTTSNASKLAG